MININNYFLNPQLTRDYLRHDVERILSKLFTSKFYSNEVYTRLKNRVQFTDKHFFVNITHNRRISNSELKDFKKFTFKGFVCSTCWNFKTEKQILKWQKRKSKTSSVFCSRSCAWKYQQEQIQKRQITKSYMKHIWHY